MKKRMNLFKLSISSTILILLCEGSDTNDFGNYSFELQAFKYPPYDLNVSNRIDTLNEDDSMILSIIYVKDESLHKNKAIAKTTTDPVTPGFPDGSLSIICDNNIEINSDTIVAGENLYSRENKTRIASQNFQNFGDIYFSGKCRFKSGKNTFTMVGTDNFGKHHKSDCIVFVR